MDPSPAYTEFPYQYNPLTEHDSIRLLLLKARHNSGELETDIIHTTISQITQSEDHTYAFTALSYNWGRKTQGRSISVGSGELLIGQNLYDALFHLRQDDADI